MTVLKFGGSSLATPDRIRHACKLMVQAHQERGAVAMVCSALGGVTNALIHTAQLAARGDAAYHDELAALALRHRETSEALLGNQAAALQTLLDANFAECAAVLQAIEAAGELGRAHQDQVMSFGERCSAQIVSRYLNQHLPAVYLDARDIIRSDARFGHAQVDTAKTNQQIRSWFAASQTVAVVTGFIASSATGETTTLGRGGSDYTAALLGAALACERIEIWTDVNGFMTADPNQVPEAFSPRTLTFEDALELAYLGAKVIYPPTLIPAMEADVPVLVKNCFIPDHPGTLIENATLKPAAPITGISAINTMVEIRMTCASDQEAMTHQGPLQSMLAGLDVPIRLMHLEHNRIHLYLDERQADWEQVHTWCLARFAQPGSHVSLHREKSLIALVGQGLGNPLAYKARISAALDQAHIPLFAYGQCRSARNISLIVGSSHQQRAQRLLHQTFFPKVQSSEFELNLTQ